MIQGYFQNILIKETTNEFLPIIPNGFPSLNEDHLRTLQQPFTKEEIKKSLFDMAPFKSPGKDGLHAGFFQKSWETIGNSLCEHVLNFLNTGTLRKCCFLKNKAIPHLLDVGFVPSYSPIKGESPSSLNHTSPIHLRLFVVLPNCFGYLLFTSIF